MFASLDDVLANETARYRDEFDVIVAATKQQTTDGRAREEDTFDNDVVVAQDNFKRHYGETVQEVRRYTQGVHLLLEQETQQYLADTLRRRSDKQAIVTRDLLNMIYGLRSDLDADDDFLKSSALEDSSRQSRQFVALSQLLGDKPVRTRDHGFLASVLASVMQLPVGDCLRYPFEKICGDLMSITSRLNMRKMLEKTAELQVDQGIYPEPTPEHGRVWHGVATLFGVVPLNRRLRAGRVVTAFPEESLQTLATMIVLNRYRHTMPYTPPLCAENRQYLSPQMDVGTDPLLCAADYDTPEGLSLLIGRTGLCLGLQQEKGSGFTCRFPSIPTVQPHHFDLGGCIYLDEQLRVQRVVLDGGVEQDPTDPVVCRRVVTNWLAMMTWSVHLGVCHFIVADEWNEAFVRLVGVEHALYPLIAILRTGVATAADVAALVLVNRLEGNIACTISDMTPSDLIELTESRQHNVADYVHLDGIIKRLGDGADTLPVVQMLVPWWLAFHTACTQFVATASVEDDEHVVEWLQFIHGDQRESFDLVETLTMMCFNTVVHELFSNNQMLYDAVENRIFTCVRRDQEDGLPSAAVHQRFIDTLVATSGTSMTWLTVPLEIFRREMERLQSVFAGDPATLTTLSPARIETSLAW